ncbi:hypothetical protein Dsin_011927 [Dipteronia sinensis]|uniref:Uncharacterized protein n=1 Tax=Dipteronia sinensis TaxID=43782 RepID=A0AAE0E800_9ROSI|nr:hypothetical protein Dsin_011927 [Dipteronia sinensis]
METLSKRKAKIECSWIDGKPPSEKFGAGHIDIRIQMDDGFVWRFSGIYGEPTHSRRVNSWTMMRRLRDVDNLLWAVEECDLIDLGFSGLFFTWNNRRKGKDNVQERLDRIFAYNPWRDRFFQVKVEHLGFNSSDHRLLLLVCNPLRKCLGKEDIGSVVSEAWSVNGHSNSVVCLVGVRNVSGISVSKLRILAEIEFLYRRCDDSGVMQTIKSLKKRVEDLLERDEIYWKQRSMADWLSAGDRNSKFFHARASARKRKNFISSLLDKNGCPQDTDVGMADTIREYFSNIFRSSTPPPSTIKKVTGGIHARLNKDMRNDFNRAFTVDEIKVTVFSMGPTEAPRLDGFQALFFQKF